MKNEEIRIYVMLKDIGSRRVKKCPFVLSRTPETFRELIEESVRSCIFAYREKAEAAKNPRPLTDEEFEAMREIGKLAFGVHYNENEVNEDVGTQTAISAVEDGIVRVFREENELLDLNGEIEINEGDSFTFIRLAMLSDRMW